VEAKTFYTGAETIGIAAFLGNHNYLATIPFFLKATLLNCHFNNVYFWLSLHQFGQATL